MNTEPQLYNQIKGIVITELKEGAKEWAKRRYSNAGTAYLSARNIQLDKNRQLKRRKGSRKLLEAFKLLGY